MKTTTQLRVSLSNDLLKKLETYANNLGLTVGEVVRHMIATNIKVPTVKHEPVPERAETKEEYRQRMAEANRLHKEAMAQRLRVQQPTATDDDDLDAILAGVPEPEPVENFQFPDEDEMQRKRQELLSGLE